MSTNVMTVNMDDMDAKRRLMSHGGLHIPEHLQYLTREENRQKSNGLM